MKIEIDSEFETLLPRLTADELSALEKSILADGCRDALILWQGKLIDGHNRHRICEKHGLHFPVAHMEFPDKSAAKLWMLQNQGGRRNLSDLARIDLARRVEDLTAGRARDNQRTSTGGADPQLLAKSPEAAVSARKAAATAARVGEKKYDEGKLILEAHKNGEVGQELVDAVQSGRVSIHAAAEQIKTARREKARAASTPEAPQAESPLSGGKTPKAVTDDADRLWLLARLDLDKILPTDISRERVLREVIGYAQERLRGKKQDAGKQGLLHRLGAWETASPDARAAFIATVHPATLTAMQESWRCLPELEQSAFVEWISPSPEPSGKPRKPGLVLDA